MIPLFSTENFDNAKSEDLLPIQCIVCSKTFYKTKHYIKLSQKKNTNQICSYCSYKCLGIEKTRTRTKQVTCTKCGKIVTKNINDIKKSKNLFCSKSCSATYNNLHKTTGNRRSKLEIWLEQQLDMLYPNLDILYNDKTTINSELDIYIKSLSLAFELNGIYHYEPIHGQEKLFKVKNNDTNKFEKCSSQNISLCIIDVSSLAYFKEKNAQKYLDIIINIINKNLLPE